MGGIPPGDAVRAWRDRVAARVGFDPDAAEQSVRAAYAACDFDPQIPILWADGPQQALAAIAFVKASPTRMRWFARNLTLLGALLWFAMAFSVTLGFGPLSRADAVSFGCTLSAFAIIIGSLRPIPLPPGYGRPRQGERILAWGAAAAVLALQIGFAWALLNLTALSSDLSAIIGTLLASAGIGILPGLLLTWRLDRAYCGLPQQLATLGRYDPVGWQFQRTRGAEWAPLRRRLGFVGWSDPLPARSRHAAHLVAFRDNVAGLLAGDVPALIERRGLIALLEWVARLFEPDAVAGAPPVHLDAMEDAPRACTVMRAGATGTALTFAEIAYHLDRLYPFRSIAVAVKPADKIELDVEDRPHCDHGPALSWPDGTAVYAWHGQPVDPSLIEDSVPLTRTRIALEPEPDRRAILIERYGLGRYMLESGAEEYQRDRCGAIYRLQQRFDEPIVAVRVLNSTPEADGSFHEYWLRCPPSMFSAREAVAWTFGLNPEEYDPQMQS